MDEIVNVLTKEQKDKMNKLQHKIIDLIVKEFPDDDKHLIKCVFLNRLVVSFQDVTGYDVMKTRFIGDTDGNI